MGHRHRSTLKQQNKAFKGSSSKPKSLKEKRRAAAANAAIVAINRPIAKAERAQQSKQRRLKQRRDLHHQQVARPTGPPPKVVLLVPFSEAICIDKVFAALTRELLPDDGNVVEGCALGMDMEEDGPMTGSTDIENRSKQCQSHYRRYIFTLPAYARNPSIPKKHLQRLLLLPAPRISTEWHEQGSGMQQEGFFPDRPSELLRYMDLCSSCDVLVCLFGGNCTYEKSAFSDRGYKVLQAHKLQGLPPSVIGVGCMDETVLESGQALQGKSAAAESLKFMRRFFESELGVER